jgi:hypothetical protein
VELDTVIQQIKALVPLMGGRVAGAADFATGLEASVWAELPAAYVIPLSDEATDNDEQNALYQVVTEGFGVVVEFDNTADRRGQGVTALYETARAGLFRALLNWNLDPDRCVQGVQYAGGHLLQFDRARLFYQWEFSHKIVIGNEDGAPTASTPLRRIDANSNPGDPPFKARVILPQE